METLFDVGFTEKDKRVRLRVGLANVHATITKHKGEIRVESKPNEGTTFEIKLPIRQSG